MTENMMTVMYMVTLRKLIFECICPHSSGTRDQQNEVFDPKGLTLVAEFDLEPFTRIFRKLDGVHHFIPTKRPHATMLGTFDKNRKNNPYYQSLVIQEITNELTL